MAKPMSLKTFLNVDYTQTGDPQLAYNAKKRKRDIPTGNTGEEVEKEALNVQQRLKRSRAARKNRAKMKIGRARAARKTATLDVLKRRARKAARKTILKKLAKGVSKDQMSMGKRQELEKRIDKMGPRIDRIARKLLPKVRKAEKERKRSKSQENKK